MKQRKTSAKTFEKDHGKELFDAILFLIALFMILWYFNV
jgi:hypothetical protein